MKSHWIERNETRIIVFWAGVALFRSIASSRTQTPTGAQTLFSHKEILHCARLQSGKIGRLDDARMTAYLRITLNNNNNKQRISSSVSRNRIERRRRIFFSPLSCPCAYLIAGHVGGANLCTGSSLQYVFKSALQ